MSQRTTAEEHAWAQDLATQLVEQTRKAGAQACDATVGVGASVSARARDGQVEKVTRSSSRGAGVRALVDGRLGFATSAQAPTTPEAVAELARTAVELAHISSPSEHNRIPDATAPSGAELDDAVARLALWHDDVAAAEAGWAAENALTMDRVLSSEEGITRVREIGAGTHRGIFALATSTGFCGGYGGTSASLSASGLAEEEGGKKQVDGWWHAARRFAELDAPEAIAKRAAERVRARVGARKVPTTKAPVIFDPQMAKTFFGAILSAINGDAVSRKASFLSGHMGEIVLAPGVAIDDDPTIPGAFGSRPFDDEGLATRAMPLIDEDGRLLTWLLDARSASKLGLSPTGHASRSSMSQPHPSSSNVEVRGGQGDLDSIIRGTERGLLVTSLLGKSPNMITGEYSRGASGVWIENGEIVHPVEEVTIAGEMLEMMKGIDRVGADHDRRSSLCAPTIRFATLSISGS
jgi:PmbA protein